MMWRDETSGAPAPIWLPLAALLIATAPAQATEIHWNGTGYVEGPRVLFDTPQDPIWVPPSLALKYPTVHDIGWRSDDKFQHALAGFSAGAVAVGVTRALDLDWHPVAVGCGTGLIVGTGKELYDMHLSPKIRRAKKIKTRAARAATNGRTPKPVGYYPGQGELWDILWTTAGGCAAGFTFEARF